MDATPRRALPSCDRPQRATAPSRRERALADRSADGGGRSTAWSSAGPFAQDTSSWMMRPLLGGAVQQREAPPYWSRCTPLASGARARSLVPLRARDDRLRARLSYITVVASAIVAARAAQTARLATYPRLAARAAVLQISLGLAGGCCRGCGCGLRSRPARLAQLWLHRWCRILPLRHSPWLLPPAARPPPRR